MQRSWIWFAAGLLAAVLPALFAPAGRAEEKGKIVWLQNYAQAAKQAKEEGKWLLVNFFNKG